MNSIKLLTLTQHMPTNYYYGIIPFQVHISGVYFMEIYLIQKQLQISQHWAVYISRELINTTTTTLCVVVWWWCANPSLPSPTRKTGVPERVQSFSLCIFGIKMFSGCKLSVKCMPESWFNVFVCFCCIHSYYMGQIVRAYLSNIWNFSETSFH